MTGFIAQIDLSIEKYKQLISNHPNSNYIIRSKKIVNYLQNDNLIKVESNKIELDSIQMLRDLAWDKLNNHIINDNPYLYIDSTNESIDMFYKIASEYDDFYSYYSLGIIYENYLYCLQIYY